MVITYPCKWYLLTPVVHPIPHYQINFGKKLVNTHTHILTHTVRFSSVSSVAQSCPTLCNPMDHSMPGLPVHHQLLEFTQTHVHWVSDANQPSHPLSPPSPALNLSQHQGLFQWLSSLEIRWPRDWSFSFSISPSNKYSGLISFRMDWLDLLAVQGTLKSLLQHRSSKVSILWHSTFFIVQLYQINFGKNLTLLWSHSSFIH